MLNKIPYGPYCYEINSIDHETGRIRVNPCPYWSKDPNMPEQENGYCNYLKMGDWDMPLGLLWDQVKECGINEEWEDE